MFFHAARNQELQGHVGLPFEVLEDEVDKPCNVFAIVAFV
jgi:hypothetical protein